METRSLDGTQTEKALLASFAGESQAANRYRMFADKAREENYEMIARMFELTIHNELAHSKLFFDYLEGRMVQIQASYPAGKVGTTLENLQAAADGEYEEWYELYPDAGEIARSEGFINVSNTFKQIIHVEKMHEERFRKIHDELLNGTLYAKDRLEVWRCIECGWEHESKEAPYICPVCKKPQGWFEIVNDKY